MTDDTDDNGFDPTIPESLLPYDTWIEDAYRQVMLKALEFVGHNGLPGEHHFYLTFRTDWPGVVIPQRLKAQYPHEMTIVLQHQFWDLKVDRDAGLISVGLAFGGVGSILEIPISAISAFADPPISLALRFTVPDEIPDDGQLPDASAASATSEPETDEEAPDPTPQVVSLDAFRKRGPNQS